jgi:hypothetical protein
MYPNNGRLLRESAVRDGGVVGGGYGNVSKGSLWGPEKEQLKKELRLNERMFVTAE